MSTYSPQSGFNPHGNVTGNGVLISYGLKVWTNELEVGIVIHDRDADKEVGCCHQDVEAGHTKAQTGNWTTWYSDHESMRAIIALGCWCGHDHWFDVLTNTGTKMMNGERLTTKWDGVKAEDAIQKPEHRVYGDLGAL